MTESKSSKPTTQPKNSNHNNSILMIIGLVTVIAGIVFVYPYAQKMFGKQREVFTNVDQLGQSHVQLRERVDKFEKQWQEFEDNRLGKFAETKAIEAIDKRLDDLQESVKKTQADLTVLVNSKASAEKLSDDDAAVVVQLRARVDMLQKQQQSFRQSLSKFPELIGALGDLKAAARTALPFSLQLGIVLNFVDRNKQDQLPNLALVEQVAVQGVPSNKELLFKLKNLSLPTQADRAAHSQDEDGLWGEVLKSAKKLVKKKGTRSRDAIKQPLSLALKRRDYPRALAYIRGLDESLRNAFSGLESQINTRLIVETFIPKLEQHALAQILAADNMGEHN
ncbi:MAG: hypothetical protein ACPGXY_00130 [Alphaproteobacteria bacterium]